MGVDSQSPCLICNHDRRVLSATRTSFTTRCFQVGGYPVRSTFKSRIIVMIVTESRSLFLSAYLSSIRLHPRPSPTTSPLPRLNAQIRSQISVPHLTRPSHHSTARLQASLPRFHPFPILLTPSSSIFPRWSPPRSHSPRRSLPSSLPVVVPFSSSSIHQNCNIYLNCPYSPMHASAELTSKRPSISQHTPHD